MLLKEVVSPGKPNSFCQCGRSWLYDNDSRLYTPEFARFGDSSFMFHFTFQQNFTKSHIFVLFFEDYIDPVAILSMEIV
jgi:hypothetical protein